MSAVSMIRLTRGEHDVWRGLISALSCHTDPDRALLFLRVWRWHSVRPSRRTQAWLTTAGIYEILSRLNIHLNLSHFFGSFLIENKEAVTHKSCRLGLWYWNHCGHQEQSFIWCVDVVLVKICKEIQGDHIIGRHTILLCSCVCRDNQCYDGK